jgi:hypothetical protein
LRYCAGFSAVDAAQFDFWEDSSVTWGEFKRAVEDRGVKDEDEIKYIDTYARRPDEIEVWRNERGHVEIC